MDRVYRLFNTKIIWFIPRKNHLYKEAPAFV
jgi:hypothetical protein